MTRWIDILKAHEQSGLNSVLLTVGGIKGSTPRETGARLLVSNEETIGTIGGGHLEFVAIKQAKLMLEQNGEGQAQILKLPLGPELAQCCGGHVDILLTPLGPSDTAWLNSLKSALDGPVPSLLLTNWKAGKVTRSVLSNPREMETIDETLQDGITRSLETSLTTIIQHRVDTDNFTLIEPIDESLFHLTLFGAGHVGKAVIQTLSPLPCRISWIDEREDMFPEEIPSNVRKIVAASPVHHVRDAPKEAFYLVMTHSHQLDLEICAEVLKRQDSHYLGLIGSQTKRQKFMKRLRLRGFDDTQLTGLTCPIGLSELDGKHPAQIAISVSAEILGLLPLAATSLERNPKKDPSLLRM